MNRQVILDQLKQDLNDNLHSGKGYKSDPVEILEGLSNFSNIIQRPIVGYLMQSDTINTEYMGMGDDSLDDEENERERIMTIILFGQEDVSYGNYTPLYDLIHDVEKFMMSSDWTYYKTTKLGDTALWVNEVDFNQAYFTVEINVWYTQNLD